MRRLALALLAGAAAMAFGQPAFAAARCRALPESEIVAPLNILGGGASGELSQALEISAAGLAAIGYRNVEAGGGLLALPPPVLNQLLQRQRLKLVGSREVLDLKTWTAQVAAAKARGQTYIAASSLGRPGVGRLDDVLQTAANLSVMGQEAREADLRLIVRPSLDDLATVYTYDLRRNDRPAPLRAFDIIAAQTEARDVMFELDARTLSLAFADPRAREAFVSQYRSRLFLANLADTTLSGAPAPPGQGITDWPSFYSQAGGGVRFYLYDGAVDGTGAARSAFAHMRCRG